MKNERSNVDSAADLRARAEKFLAAEEADLGHLPWDGVRKLVRDLWVRQSDLESQNQELRRMQKTISKSQDPDATLFDLAPVAYFSLDPQGLMAEVNVAGARLMGAPRDSLLKTPFIRFVAPGNHEDFQAHLQAGPKGGVSQSRDLLLRPQQGPPFSASLESLAILDAEGKVIRYHTVVRNITKRKQAEENLRKSEALYRLIVETANEGIWGIDGDLQTTYVNPVITEMLGYQMEEMLSRPVSDFIFPEDMCDFEDKMAQLREGQDETNERRFKRKDGSEFWAIISHRSLMDGQGRFQGGFAMLTDITQRRQADEALRLAARQWQATFDAMSEGICLMDLNCRILGCNQAMTSLVGEPVDEILGSYCFEIVHGTSQPIPECPLVTMCQSRQREEVILPHKERWFKVTVDPIQDEAGALMGAVHRIADITRLKESEEALKESEAHFRQLFECAADAIFLHDQGRIIEVNEQACCSLGYTRQELLRLHITDIEVGIDRDELLETFKHDPPKGTFFGIQQRRDGSTFPVEIRTRSFPTQGLNLRLAVVRDITAQREAEKAIRESEGRFRELFNHMKSGVAIYEVTPNGKKIIIRDLNRAAERIEVIKKKALLGKDVREVFPGAEATGLVEAILRVWESGQPEHIPLAFYRDERISGWRESFIFRLPQGEVVVVYDDITTRVNDIQALRQSRETLRVLLDATPAGVMLLDPQAMIVAINRMGANFLRKTIKELVGTKLFEHLPVEVVQTDKDHFEEIKRSRQSFSFEESRWGHDFVNYVHPILSISAELAGFAVLSVDITERKQAEEALRQSRKDLNRAQAVAHTGSWRMDMRGNELTWSDETYRIFGISFGTPLTYEAFLAVVHPEDREYVDRKWTEALESEPYDIEHRILVGNEVKWVRELAELEFDSQRQLLGGFGTCQDITERKQVEEALRQSRETLRVLLDATPAGVCLLDPQGIILAANKELAQRLGKAVQEIVGTCLFEYLSSGLTQTRQNRMEQIKTLRQPLRFEDKHDGLIFDVFIHPIFSATGELAGLAVLSVDITERKRAEQALAQQSQFLQLLIDTIPAPVFYKDAEGRYLGCNRNFLEYHGITKEEMVGKTVDCIPNKELVEKYRQKDLELFQNPGVQVYENTMYWPDGSKREVVINKATFPKSDGSLGGLVGVFNDVTEIKEAQRELRALAARLAELEEKERHIMARELHDEVGQGLTALGLNLTLLKAQMPQKTPASLLSRLTDAVVLVEKIGETIRNVMAELRPPVLDDYGLLSALRWYGAEFSQRTGIDVEVHGEEAAPRLARSVELALFRIAQEALTNVSKHSRASRVELTEMVNNGTIRLIIADNGVGFDRDKLGQPEGRYRWGLMNMSERAAAAGGRCSVESQPGHGTKVVVEVSR